MYVLSPLPYAYDALEPVIDEATMRLHHDKHHQAYVDKFNLALSNFPELEKLAPEELLRQFQSLVQEKVPADIANAIKNHGGGVVNHNLFWELLTHGGATEPQGELREAIRAMGGFEKFKASFSELATKHFGSGWAWLVVDQDKNLQMYSLPNQDSPLLQGHQPILAIDVWEHAYYLKYQNRRNEYLEAIWQLVNWSVVDRYYQAANA
jgi:Fe-Mn family superoxide dismutase